jgi:ketosteroid isomerase-like protein
MNNMRHFIGISLCALILCFTAPLPAAEGYASPKDEADVARLSAQWREAVLKSDADAMDKIIADDYTFVDPNGTTWSKGQEMDMYRTGDVKFESLAPEMVKVRIYVGGAVVTGKLTAKGAYKKTDISGEYRFIEVYESGKGGWKAVYAQLTKVPEKTEKK